MPSLRSEARVIDNDIYDNSAAVAGGGIRFCYFFGTLPRPEVQRNLIHGNDALDGGGIRCFDADSLTLEQCVISGNVATRQGGGFMTSGETLDPAIDFVRCTVEGNESPEQFDPPTGGGIYATGGRVSLTSSIVSSNRGGGLVCSAPLPPPEIISDYCDVWNNTDANYHNCSPGPHSISADPQYCEDFVSPWFLILDTSPGNGTGWWGYDIGAGWVGCYSVPSVVFYDNFSDQADDGWITQESWPGQIAVEAGEYSMHSASEWARSHVAQLSLQDLELTAWMMPKETSLGGETRLFFRLDPVEPAWYEVDIRTEAGEGELKRVTFNGATTLARFACEVEPEMWHTVHLTALGAHLTGAMSGPLGDVPFYDLYDLEPLGSGTIGLGVAWLSAPDRGAQHTHFDRVMVRDIATAAAVYDMTASTAAYPLRALPTPNPTRGSVDFRILSGARDAALRLEILDLEGRCVRSIAGTTVWDGRTGSGEMVPRGMYAWRLHAGTHSTRGRVLVVR